MINFACSKCGKSIRVDDRHAGKKGKCPKCGAPVVVPERSTIIEFHCDNCGRKIKVPDHHAGRKGRCPQCKEPIVVPALPEEPVAESAAPTIICAMCGQTVQVAEGSAGQSVECPGCGSLLDPSSGSVVSEPEAAAHSETDEDLYEEPAPEPEESGGLNRRLLILIGGAAVVVVVAIAGLLLFLRSPDSGPVQRPPRPRPQRNVAQSEPAPEPVVAEPAPIEQTTPPPTAAPPTAGSIRLQFRPTAGIRKTMRVSTRVVVTSEEEGQKLDMTGTQSFTFNLETQEAQADGTIPIQVTLAAVQVKTEMTGMPPAEYDSTKPQSEGNLLAQYYVPFIGKHFTIGVSAQGEITDPGLDALFLAAAQDRMAAEDDMIRERLKGRADAAIERTNQQFGSRDSRVLALKKQLEEFPVFSTDEARSLLDHMTAALPAEPVQPGTRWNAPVTVRASTNLEIRGTYTVTAIEDDSCTITAEGERSLEEEPFTYQMGSTVVSNKLGGPSRVSLTVDRQTGWLRAKEQTTSLSGRVLRTNAAAPGQESFSDDSIEITTTVSSVD